MRAILAVVVGLIAWIVTLFIESLVTNDGTLIPHGGLLAVLIGVIAAAAWYVRGWYPSRTL